MCKVEEVYWRIEINSCASHVKFKVTGIPLNGDTKKIVCIFKFIAKKGSLGRRFKCEKL